MATPILVKQKEYLDSLICERMSDNPSNLWHLDPFVNNHNPQLVYTIQNEANESDENGEIAFYLYLKTFVFFIILTDLFCHDR